MFEISKLGTCLLKVIPRFELGRIAATPGALAMLTSRGIDPCHLLVRHVSGDFGDLCPEDIQANELAVYSGMRLLSSYQLSESDRIWIITEWDRSVTTLLLPSEY